MQAGKVTESRFLRCPSAEREGESLLLEQWSGLMEGGWMDDDAFLMRFFLPPPPRPQPGIARSGWA